MKFCKGKKHNKQSNLFTVTDFGTMLSCNFTIFDWCCNIFQRQSGLDYFVPAILISSIFANNLSLAMVEIFLNEFNMIPYI